ncbi:hypothetical protein RIF29_18333 [Crotalaria pallida]|uniref:Peptidase A1 domain-containing protein n=1 Tax=Crotalaria pallida TaxID=3830 RepID=A0AAN9FIP1_CROPI
MASYSSSIAFLLLCIYCFSFIGVLGFSVELIHQNSPRSPYYNPYETYSQRVTNVIHNSINRASHFNQTISSTHTPPSNLAFNNGYIVTYSIGTPPFHYFGLIDTSSDLIWLECKPCKTCAIHKNMFDPSKSTTYKTIPCTSDKCHSVRNTSCSSGVKKTCNFTNFINGLPAGTGDLSLETLTIDSNNNVSPVSFKNIVVGCVHDSFVSVLGGPTSIVSLGNGPNSLVSQMSPSIGAKFSYCLVPIPLTSIPTPKFIAGKLHFGDDAVVSGDGTVSTPMTKKGHYLLTLEGFSVGNNRIEFENSFYGGGGGGGGGQGQDGNIVIDMYESVTLLPNDLYSKFELAVSKAMKLERTADPNGLMSLCYKGTLTKLEIPIITAHFRGADVKLNTINAFMQVAPEVVCLAFIPTKFQDYVTYGGIAQMNFLVGYDLQKNTVSFKPIDCSK